MTLDELAFGPWRRELAATAEADALTDVDALQEAELIEFRFDAVRSTVALLLDLRGAIQIEAANTALVVVHGIRSFAWSGTPLGNRTAWTVVGWSPVTSRGVWSVTAGLFPDAALELSGSGAAFYVGDVPGGDLPPPDYGDASEQEMRTGLPGWQSELDIKAAMFVD